MHPLRSFHAVALLALAPLAGAQDELFPAADKVVLDALDAAPGSLTGRALAGDVTGDLLPDALWIRDGKPFVVYGAAAYRSSFAADVAATDLALLAASAPGAAQRLLVVNASGLWLLAGYDGGFAAPTLVSGGVWAGATRVRVGDTDGDGCEDVIGLSSAGSLLLLEGRCDAPNSSELAQPAPVLDFVALDWDGVPGDELAVLRPDGFFVLARTGAVLHSELAPLAGGFLAPIREAGLGRERCAAVYSALGSQFVVVLDLARTEDPLELGAGTAFFGASAADADGDGRDDLCLMARVAHQALLLLNQGPPATFSFAPDAAQLIPLADGPPPPATWAAWPLLSDFSLDGDPDLLVFVEGTGELVYFEDAHTALARDQVRIPGGAYVFHKDTKQGELLLHALVPDSVTFATDVQVIAWREVDALGEIQAQPVANLYFPLDANGKTLVRLEFPEHDVYTTNVYHMDVRAVRREGVEQTVVASGPPAVHAFTTPQHLTSQLEAEFGEGIELRTFLVGSPSGKSTVKALLGPPELLERALAPKDVKTLRIPKTVVPPDPF